MEHSGSILFIFGATGDLAAKKILPALQQWNVDETPFKKIWCLGRRQLDEKDYISLIESKGDFRLSETLRNRIGYHKLEFEDFEAYESLAQRLPETTQAAARLFFLAVKPDAFHGIAANLYKTGLFCKGKSTHRLLFEKPFGESLESAREIQSRLAANADEEQIYRIDHYLGKEMIRNVLAIRLANRIFSESWHSRAIETVEITSVETAGVEERLDYYDKAGAINDMVQSHLLQMLALVAMETPENLESEPIRRQKLSILEHVKLEPECRPIIGQYQGYKLQADGSTTETYVEAVLQVDIPQWHTTRFILKTGKKLGEKRTEIRLLYRPNSLCLSCSESINAQPNQLVIEVFPREGVLCTFNSKTPGYDFTLESVEADYCHSCRFTANKPEAYVKLLKDALLGDKTLFASFEELQVQWRIADQISAAAQKGDLMEYPPGTMNIKTEGAGSC
ncbi:MAG: glucose-6-phosphate dehydrogenase [Desulforhopalus sp.]